MGREGERGEEMQGGEKRWRTRDRDSLKKKGHCTERRLERPNESVCVCVSEREGERGREREMQEKLNCS